MCMFFRYRFGRSITLTFRLSQVQICNILYINICTVYCRYIFNNIRICALSYCSLSEDLWRLYKNYNSCKCWGCWAVVTQPLWAASDYPAGLHHWSLIPASSNKWSSGCPGMHVPDFLQYHHPSDVRFTSSEKYFVISTYICLLGTFFKAK